jgi:hypothetical protein
MKTESRKQTRDRLMAEGRWPAFVAKREDLKTQGKAPAEAHRLALDEFQPLDATRATPRAGGEKRDGRKKGRPATASIKRDLLWAYEQMGRAEPKGAPSSGARELHKQAREHPWEFLQIAIQRLVSPRAEEEEAGERKRRKAIEAQDQTFLDTVDEFLAELKQSEAAGSSATT